MHIFHIPSWYPTTRNSNFGIFIKEGIQNLSRYTDSYHSVALWGQDRCMIRKSNISPQSVISLFKCGKERIINKNDKMVEIYKPVIYWSHKFLSGNIGKIIQSTRIILYEAIKVFGKVDLIHAHVSYPAGYVAMVLSDELKIPFVLSEHMGPFPLPNFIHKNGNISNLLKLPLQKAKKVIAVSKFLAREIENKVKVKPIVIYNPVNELFLKCPLKVKKNHYPFTFLFIGSFTYEKGFDILVESVKLLSETTKDFLIITIGDKNKRKFKKTVPESLWKYFKVAGEVPHSEIYRYFINSDALIHPSRFETFGMVVAEAMACGKPVVVTKCGGPEEFVDNEAGYLVEHDPIKFAEAIENLMLNYSKFNPHRIREKILNKLHPGHISSEIYRVYQEIVEGT